MAITSTEQTAIIKTVSALFNKAFTPETTTKFFNFYENNGKDLGAFADGLIGSSSYEAQYAGAGTMAEFGAILMNKYNMTYGGTSTADQKMTAFIEYSFAHAADDNSLRTIQAVDKYIVATLLPSVTAGNVFETMNTVIENKAEVAIDFKNNPANSGKEYNLSAVTDDDATVTAAKGETSAGKTYDLTVNTETLTGAEFNDVFNANYDVVNSKLTLTALDTIDGGAGTDTLKITHDNASDFTLAAATIKNVEKMTIAAAQDVTADVSGSNITGLESVSVTKSVDATVTAGTSTDVNVSGATGVTSVTGGKTVTISQDIGTALSDNNNAVNDAVNEISVNGAVNVNITATNSLYAITNTNDTDTDGGISVGGTTAVTGTVDITSTGKALVGNDGAVTLDNIYVQGGTTVNVTQVAAASYGNVASKNAGSDDIVTQGDITIDATTVTTEINVKQDAAVSAKNAAATTGGVTESASVKFGILKAGDSLTISTDGDGTKDSGEFTIKAVKNMSASEVAAAFAKLVNDTAKGTLLAGDTQGTTAYTTATYSENEAAWTTASASGDTLVFTSNSVNTNVTDLVFVLTNTSTTSVDPIVTTTQGKANDATMAGGVTGIVDGKVDITANSALTTVTVDGYGASSNINGTAAALETIKLSNGAAFTVSDTASTVTLTLEKVTGAVTFTAQPSTLNVVSVGDNTSGIVSSAVTTALNVSGTGLLNATNANLGAVKNIVVTETAGLNLTGATLTALESVDTTGTTGAVTVSIGGTATSYAGGAGVDTLTVSNAGTSITKSIDLGAGDDKLILTGSPVVTPTSTLKGGDGIDTLSISALSAVSLSASTAFAAKLSSFERLEITGATGTQAVDLEKLGFTSYVTVAGVTNSGTDVLTLNNLANNATVVINAAVADGITAVIKDADTNDADVLNVEITNETSIAAATLNTDNIETVNLTVTDVFIDDLSGNDTNDATHTLTFDSDTATTLNVSGTAGLTLTLANDTTKLVTIDASDMTEGGLTVTANGANAMTITGGDGADVLTASTGSNAKADVLVGGAGNDVLVAGTNGATLTGGEGNDLFVLTATSAVGNKEDNTYSIISDFSAGDKIKLSYFETNAANADVVTSFSKLSAVLNADTASFSNFVDAAMAQMTDFAQAVWFSYKGSSYIVVDSNEDATGTYSAQTGFIDGEDLIIKVADVDLTGASFNSTYGTIEIA